MITKEFIEKLKKIDPEGELEIVCWLFSGVYPLNEEDQIDVTTLDSGDGEGEVVVAIFPE